MTRWTSTVKGYPPKLVSAMQSGTERSEIEKALESMIGTLEDSDPRQRAYGYTEDVVFVMPGAPVVRGREEMLKRLESAAIMWSVTITPLTIEGTYTWHGQTVCLPA